MYIDFECFPRDEIIDGEFKLIKSRFIDADVPDGQRSSLLVELQSVSESLMKPYFTTVHL